MILAHCGGGGGGEPEVAMRKMKKMIQIMNMSVQDNEFSKLKRMMLSSAHEKNDLTHI